MSDKAKDMLARANCKNGKANSKAKPTRTKEESGWVLDVGWWWWWRSLGKAASAMQIESCTSLASSKPSSVSTTKYRQQSEELTSFRPLKFCKRPIKSGVLCDLCFDGTFSQSLETFYSRTSQATEQNVVFLFQQSPALSDRDLEMIK